MTNSLLSQSLHNGDRNPSAADGTDSLRIFGWVLLLFTLGTAVGALAGRWDHPFSAMTFGLPAVALAAYWYPQRVASVVAIGVMTAWNATREIPATEPAWSIVLTFVMSLLILFGASCLVLSLLSARDRAQHFAEIEPLTGLLNRNAFLNRLTLEVDRSRRCAHPLAVAFLDCDHFKQWNDTQGHLAGDELLRIMAATLRHSTRTYDVIARMGGDEFAVLFPELPPRRAEATAKRLHDDLRREFQARGLPVTASIGMVAFHRPPVSAQEIIVNADMQMYGAKRLGKDRAVTLIDPQLNAVSGAVVTPTGDRVHSSVS